MRTNYKERPSYWYVYKWEMDKYSDQTIKITSSDLGGEKECREGRFTSKQSRSLGTRLRERHYELHVQESVDFRVYENYCCLFLQPRTRTGLPRASCVPPCNCHGQSPAPHKSPCIT